MTKRRNSNTDQLPKENEAQFQAVLDTAVDAIIVINDRGVIETANPAVERLFGYSIPELIGCNVSILMPSPDREQHDEYIARYLATGQAHIIGIGREVEARHRDGSLFPAELAISKVNVGDLTRFTGIIRDISARKQTEKALRESQARIQAILETAVDAIITIDQNGTVESANPAVERMFGYKLDELIGHNISMLMPSPDRESHDGYIARYLSTAEAHIIGVGREVKAMRRDGTTFPIELAISEVNAGDRRRFTGIIRDITARKIAEEALLRADALKDEFLANTSHELRTPLSGIIGIGQSLLDGAAGDLTDEQQQNLRMIVASGRRLANLVNDVLDFSKLRHETIQLRRQPTDLHALTDLVLTVSRSLIGRREIRLFNRLNPQVPLVDADEQRVQQIMFNLVGNAIKFTPGGAVEVSGTIRNGWLDVTVSDTGIGIKPERLGEIFESFSQGDGSVAREYGGTGLGLAITKQLVELHGGTIGVESQLEIGSRFTFSLPLSQTTRAMLKPDDQLDHTVSRVVSDMRLTESTSTGAPTAPRGGNRVLVVDDEPVNIQALTNYLTLAKYDVETAISGEEALNYLSGDEPCDLVLLDVMMPKLSGFEVCERIRERYSPTELPVILLTAKNRVSDLVTGFGAGANDYLTKPFASEELLARVRVHLELAKISDSYARFVPRQFLEQLGKDRIVDVVLGDQVQREMTVLFSDMRDFTQLAEGMGPAETFQFINEYLGAVGPAISECNGVIDKYVGDAVMALFPNSADDAIRGSLEMLRRLEAFNAERAKTKAPRVRIGIGLHTGKLMLGTVGAHERMDTTVISDSVNLASRVENLTKTYGVPLIITEETLHALKNPGETTVRRIDRVLVQGRSQAVVLYEVLDAEEPSDRRAKLSSLRDFESAINCYESRDFTAAITNLERALAMLPSDSVAQLLLERSKRFSKEGMQSIQDGAIRLQKADSL